MHVSLFREQPICHILYSRHFVNGRSYVKDVYPLRRGCCKGDIPLAYNTLRHPVQRVHTMAARLEGMFALPFDEIF